MFPFSYISVTYVPKRENYVNAIKGKLDNLEKVESNEMTNQIVILQTELFNHKEAALGTRQSKKIQKISVKENSATGCVTPNLY